MPSGTRPPRPPRKGPPPPPPCFDGGYIVERIVQRQSETLCYDGLLTLSGLACGLCPPLTLCDVQVVSIKPASPAPRDVCGPCETYAPGGCENLSLTLLCSVVDARGCSGEGCATVCVQSCARACDPWQGLSVRRGAQVYLGHSRFCAPGAFEVSLKLILQTLFSRAEWTGGRPPCPPDRCPTPLPLYPPPVRRFP